MVFLLSGRRAQPSGHFVLHTSKSYFLLLKHGPCCSFSKALEVIKKLKEVMPIDRAKMKLRITTDEDAAPLKEALGELGVVSFESGGGAGPGGGGGDSDVLDFLVDPGMYRDVEEAVRTVAGCVRICWNGGSCCCDREAKQQGLLTTGWDLFFGAFRCVHVARFAPCRVLRTCRFLV